MQKLLLGEPTKSTWIVAAAADCSGERQPTFYIQYMNEGELKSVDGIMADEEDGF